MTLCLLIKMNTNLIQVPLNISFLTLGSLKFFNSFVPTGHIVVRLLVEVDIILKKLSSIY